MAKKVLLIEDEQDQIKLVTLRLKAKGYEVHSSTDGEKGLAKAKELKPDLILLDVLLPKMNGLEVCRLLRADSSMSSIPIILFTALANEEFDQNAKDVKANAIIGKPYDAKVLLEKISSLLGDK